MVDLFRQRGQDHSAAVTAGLEHMEPVDNAPTDTNQSDLVPRLYLDLMKRCLTRSLFPESLSKSTVSPRLRSQPLAWFAYSVLKRLLEPLGLELWRRGSSAERAAGRDWPSDAETMVGLARLGNLEMCVTEVLRTAVPGDLIETGAWRGGACIFMRAILKAYGNRDKTVWVADSFQGLPRPDGRFGQDAADTHWQYADVLAVPLEQVRRNFERYGLLDDQVRFLPGWFSDTLPTAAIRRIAVLRLDGDMYSSTMDALTALYPRLSSGGYVIVDDYGAVSACRQAVDDYRRAHGIEDPLLQIDWTGVYWKRSG
jgi:O-methyltransferase